MRSLLPSRRLAWLATTCTSLGSLFLLQRPMAAAAKQTALPAALELADEAFYAETVNPKLEVQLLESKFVGVALRAPRRVEVGERSTLPLLIASRFDGARDWDFPLHDLGWLLGIELGSGKLHLHSAFDCTKRPAPNRRGTRPSGDELGSYGAQVNLIDGRSRLGVAWQPGCWAFFLIYYDWVSNRVVVRLDQASGGQTKPASGEACTPRSSARTQLSFRLDRAPEGAIRVSGRFAVPASSLVEGRKELPATLLIVAPDGATPEQIAWQIPVKSRPGARRVRGTLDHAFSPSRRPPGGTVAYLIIAGHVFGPRPWTAEPSRP